MLPTETQRKMTNEKEIRSYLEDEYMSLSEKVNALVIVFKQARKEAIEECIEKVISLKEYNEGRCIKHSEKEIILKYKEFDKLLQKLIEKLRGKK